MAKVGHFLGAGILRFFFLLIRPLVGVNFMFQRIIPTKCISAKFQFQCIDDRLSFEVVMTKDENRIITISVS